MYSKITNPETGRQVSIYGKRGQMVLRKYLTIIQQTVGGGFGSNDKWNGRGGGMMEYVDITGAGDPKEKFQSVYQRDKPDRNDSMFNGRYIKVNADNLDEEIKKFGIPSSNLELVNDFIETNTEDGGKIFGTAGQEGTFYINQNDIRLIIYYFNPNGEACWYIQNLEDGVQDQYTYIKDEKGDGIWKVKVAGNTNTNTNNNNNDDDDDDDDDDSDDSDDSDDDDDEDDDEIEAVEPEVVAPVDIEVKNLKVTFDEVNF